MPPIGRHFLYFSLHRDILDRKTTFLIKTDRIIILRINAQLQICAAERSGKGMNIFHHLSAKALIPEFLIHADFIHEHDSAPHNTRPIKFTDFQKHIPHKLKIVKKKPSDVYRTAFAYRIVTY